MSADDIPVNPPILFVAHTGMPGGTGKQPVLSINLLWDQLKTSGLIQVSSSLIIFVIPFLSFGRGGLL